MSAIVIKRAVRDVLASELDPLPVPQTSLTEDAVIGATTLTIEPCLDVQSRSRIVEGSRLTFHDGLGEMTVTVASITPDGATVQLETSTAPGGFPGFTVLHTAGTMIYANLVAYGPFDASKALALGDPVIFVTTLKRRRGQQATQAGFPLYFVRIQSNRRLSRPDKTIDQESWAQYCEDATAADLDAIDDVLFGNQELITDWNTGVAVKGGQYASSDDQSDITLGPQRVDNGGTWHYVGTLDLLVTGNGQSLK
jgi:hypothetical protein